MAKHETQVPTLVLKTLCEIVTISTITRMDYDAIADELNIDHDELDDVIDFAKKTLAET